jgi:hypothetical protein
MGAHTIVLPPANLVRGRTRREGVVVIPREKRKP